VSGALGTKDAHLERRRRRAAAFRLFCAAMTCLGVVLLVVLLARIAKEGLPWLDLQFLASAPSRFPAKAGILPSLAGSAWIVLITAVLSIPLGVGAAIYLEEYAPRNRATEILEINLANLAGVPSIIYGILGLALFVRGLALGQSVLSGALTMSLLVLPVIVVAAREAIRAVPLSFRHGALALGATRWQTVRHHVLPSALPGILTGIILSLSRAIGESAPLILVGAVGYVAFLPATPMDEFSVLPIQIFNWTSRPQAEFHGIAAAGILVLLAALVLLNSAALVIRERARRRRPW
jgi:phosphate transport system permease protein